MTDPEIRQLVRSAIAKHLGGQASTAGPTGGLAPSPAPAAGPSAASVSFYRYALPRTADDVMCLIEPAVKCNHCGYCECHGH
jgi:hypothetical protein